MEDVWAGVRSGVPRRTGGLPSCWSGRRVRAVFRDQKIFPIRIWQLTIASVVVHNHFSFSFTFSVHCPRSRGLFLSVPVAPALRSTVFTPALCPVARGPRHTAFRRGVVTRGAGGAARGCVTRETPARCAKAFQDSPNSFRRAWIRFVYSINCIVSN